MSKVAKNAQSTVDARFYLPADEFFRASIPTALTFDDVTLATLYSEILPREADTSTSISESLGLQIPIISSDMDTVTETRMAIAMALNGGMGLIHYNMPANEQVKEAVQLLEYVVKIREQILAEDHPHRLASRHELARAYHANGEANMALMLIEHVVEIKQRSMREDHPSRHIFGERT